MDRTALYQLILAPLLLLAAGLSHETGPSGSPMAVQAQAAWQPPALTVEPISDEFGRFPEPELFPEAEAEQPPKPEQPKAKVAALPPSMMVKANEAVKIDAAVDSKAKLTWRIALAPDKAATLTPVPGTSFAFFYTPTPGPVVPGLFVVAVSVDGVESFCALTVSGETPEPPGPKPPDPPKPSDKLFVTFSQQEYTAETGWPLKLKPTTNAEKIVWLPVQSDAAMVDPSESTKTALFFAKRDGKYAVVVMPWAKVQTDVPEPVLVWVTVGKPPDPPPPPSPIASVTVTPASATVAIGATAHLSATVKDLLGNILPQPVSWASNNPAVATVAGDGRVNGVAAGTATITASAGGKVGTAAITVGEAPSPAPIPVEGFRVLIVFESQAVTTYPAGQQSVLYGQTVRNYLDSKCVKEGKQSAYWMLDKDTDVSKLAKHWQDAWKRPRASVPWMIVSNGKAGWEGPLPNSVADAMAIFKKYGE